MTDRWPGEGRAGNADDHPDEHYLVDGVAPSVIGGEDGPDPAPGEDGERHGHEPRAYRDPPTAPIPVQGGEQRKPSWIGRMFGRG